MRGQFRTGTILNQASNREAKIRGVVAGTRWRECLASDGTWLHIVPVLNCPRIGGYLAAAGLATFEFSFALNCTTDLT